MTRASEAELRPAVPARAGGVDPTDVGTTAVLPGEPGAPLDDFALAAEAVLAHLAVALPLPTWVVARVDGDDGVVLASAGGGPDLARGATFCVLHALSARLLEQGPCAVPDVHAAGAESPNLGGTVAGAYVSVPLCRPDGTRFGVLAGFGPDAVGAELTDGLALAELLGRLLTGLLAVVVRAEADAREHDRAGAT